MKNTPEEIEQLGIAMAIFMSIIVIIFVPIGIYYAFETTNEYQEKYTNNSQANKYILGKANKKAIQFLIGIYAFLIPLIAVLIYLVKSIIILHPCLALMVASIFVIKGTKENYLEEFTKEYEKLYPNEN